MLTNINEVQFKNRIVLLVQSFPALRLLYFLVDKNYKILVVTSNQNVKRLCQSLAIPYILICPKIQNYYLIFLIPKFLLRYTDKLLKFRAANKALRRLGKYKDLDFIITIVGMDWNVLPAFLNLGAPFYYWDDSFYAKRHKSTSSSLFVKLKNSIQNLVYKTKFELFNDDIMVDFPWTEVNRLPKHCLQLSGQIDSVILPLKHGSKFNEKKWKIVLIGDYDFYEMSKKCNIVKLIRLVEKLRYMYPDKVFYKAHPGSTSQSHKALFGDNEIDSFLPIEIIGNSCEIILTLGSAAAISLKNTSTRVVGIGELVDMCRDLFPMSEVQGVRHVEDFGVLTSMLGDLPSSANL
tara:strand:- start:26108 stop:27154 length:1047 start_codon:yes stop_codon:yes gene_type:complete